MILISYPDGYFQPDNRTGNRNNANWLSQPFNNSAQHWHLLLFGVPERSSDTQVTYLAPLYRPAKHIELTQYNKIKNWVQYKIGNELTDDALEYLLDLLLEDNYKRLRKYDPEKGASPVSFLKVVYHNLLRDYMKKRFGDLAIPDEIALAGELFAALYRDQCWHKLPKSILMDKYVARFDTPELLARTIRINEDVFLKRRKYDFAENAVDIHDVELEEQISGKSQSKNEHHATAIIRYLTEGKLEGLVTRKQVTFLLAEFSLDCLDKQLFALLGKGLSIVDIAMALNLHRNAVTNRKKRVVQRLKALMARHYLGSLITRELIHYLTETIQEMIDSARNGGEIADHQREVGSLAYLGLNTEEIASLKIEELQSTLVKYYAEQVTDFAADYAQHGHRYISNTLNEFSRDAREKAQSIKVEASL